LQPPRTLDEFFTVAEQLKAKGITPLSVGGADGFEVPQLFESVLLAVYGPEDYVRLMQGDAFLWADARLETAIATLKKMLDVANTDHSLV
jgi:glucose/mannose transport system substrate-binding protein